MSCRHANIKTPTNQWSSNISKLKEDHLQPGDCILLNKYESSTRGRLPNTRGHEAESDKSWGGTIAVDHTSGKIWVHHQVSLQAGKNLQAKHKIEYDFNTIGCKILKYYSDNVIFKAKEFQADLQLHQQSINFSGVGAHHQNGVRNKPFEQLLSGPEH